RRLPRRDRAGLRTDPEPGARGRLRLGLFVHVLAAPRHPGRRHGRADARRGQPRPVAAPAGVADRAAGRLQPGPGRAAPTGAVREEGPPRGPGHRPVAVPAVGPRGRRGPSDRPDRAGPHRLGGAEQPGRTAAAAGRRLMARGSEFHELSDRALRAVLGPHSRHVALIEDAFKVLIEAPGGGVSINGSTRDRSAARAVVEALAARAEQGVEVAEADVRAALSSSRSGGKTADGLTLPVGRRGPIAPKNPAQARYLESLAKCELTFGVGPAGTGKTFLAAAYGASLLRKGQVDRLVITRPAVEAGERLGFLPGDLTEKVDPYLAPIWQALDEILGADELRRRRDKGEI